MSMTTDNAENIETPYVLHRASLALYGVMFLIFIYVGRIQELFPFLEKAKLGKVGIFVALGLYLFSPPAKLSGRLMDSAQFRAVCVIALFSLLSIPLSVWPGQSLDFIINSYAKILLFFYLLVKTITSEIDIKKIYWTILGVTLLLVIMMVKNNAEGRISVSSSYDPNDIALLLVMCLPFAYYMIKHVNMVVKLLLVSMIMLMSYAIILTASRGGFISLIVVAGYILFDDKTVKMIHKAFVVLLAGAVFMFAAPDSYWQRMSSISNYQQDYNVTASTGRIELWKRGLKYMVQNPLLGVGVGAYSTAEGMNHAGEGGWKWSTAHNAYVQLGASIGLIGLFFFLKLLWTTFIRMRSYAKTTDFGKLNSTLAQSLAASTVAYAVGAIFLSQAFFSMLYLIVGLSISLGRMQHSQTEV